jgi:hypothetical protein
MADAQGPVNGSVDSLEDQLSRTLSELRKSASRREALLEYEKDLILGAAAALKSMGHSPAHILVSAAAAEEDLRERLGITPDDDRMPTVEQLVPLLTGQQAPWPGIDYVNAPSVRERILLLRQQNAPWGRGNEANRLTPPEPERLFWNPETPNDLWSLRILLGANQAMTESWAPKKELDQLSEALRFNLGRVGRRPVRVVEFLIEWRLYLAYRGFFGILKKAQREIPRSLRKEDQIREALAKREFPAFFIERLAQEIFEHRQRRGKRLKIEDRAALLTVELEGKRGEYGLPEPLSLDESMGDEDVSLPVIVTTRKPVSGPFRTTEAAERYGKALKAAVVRARSRVRRLEAVWNSTPPESPKE